MQVMWALNSMTPGYQWEFTTQQVRLRREAGGQ